MEKHVGDEYPDIYKIMVTVSPNAILVANLEGKILSANPKAEEYFGYSQNELLDLSIESLLPERFRQRHKLLREQYHESPFNRAMGSGKSFMAIKKDGTEFPIEIGLTPLHTNKGMLALVTISDVTNRYKMEEQLRASEQKYRLLFENMNEGFALHELICDDKGNPYDYKFLDLNPAFEKQTGLKKEVTIGKTVRELLPGVENDPADWIGKYGNVALKGIDLTMDNYSGALKKWYRVHGFPGQKGQFAVTFTDITSIKENEKKLTELNEFNNLIFENSSVGIIIYKATGERVSANNPAAKIVGAKQKQFLKQNFNEIRSWKKSGIYEIAVDTLETGKIHNATKQILTRFNKI